MKTEIDIPSNFLKLCEEWHGGQSSMFYAISSTGSLKLGSIKPPDCESEKDWMLYLLDNLISEIEFCMKTIDGNGLEKLEFVYFHALITKEINNLRG